MVTCLHLSGCLYSSGLYSLYSSKVMGHFLEELNKNLNRLFSNLVQPLAVGLFGLAANPIAKSYI